jgi:hypothetical protein
MSKSRTIDAKSNATTYISYIDKQKDSSLARISVNFLSTLLRTAGKAPQKTEVTFECSIKLKFSHVKITFLECGFTSHPRITKYLYPL